MTATQSQPYQVHKGAPGVFYVQEVATGELKALPFRTKKAAQAAVDEWNARRARPKLSVVR